MASAIARPSLVLVPLPSSSTMARAFPLMFPKMKDISLISVEKVDRFASIQSSVDMRTNNCSTIEKWAYSAGTKQPICAMICRSAIILM